VWGGLVGGAVDVTARRRAVPVDLPLGSEQRAGGPRPRVAPWIAAFVFLVLLVFQGGDLAWSDGISMYQVARSIVEDRDVAIVQGVVWEGADGRYYSPFGIGLSLLAVPVYAGVWVLRRVVPVPAFVAQGLVSLLAPAVLALVSVSTFALARRLGGHLRSSALAAVGVAGGTFLLIYGKTFSSEPLAALLVTLAIERVLAGSPTWAGAALGGAALARPQTFLFAPFLVWGLWRSGGGIAMLRGAWPVLLAAAVQIAYNVARFGDPTNFGYSGTEVPQGFTTPILVGLRGLLLHPEKSVLLFAPIVLLVPPALVRLFRVDRLAGTLITAQLLITVVLAATWWDWGGGFTWGPRLLIPAIPPIVAAVVPWADERAYRARAVAWLFVVGFVVSAPSLMVGGGAQLAEDPPPEEGPRIAGQYRLVPEAVAYTIDHLYEGEDGRDPTRVLYLWQAGMAYRVGRPGLVASLGITAVLLVAAGVTLRGLLARLRDVERGSDHAGSASGRRRGIREPHPDPRIHGELPAPGREGQEVQAGGGDEEPAMPDREREVLEDTAQHRPEDVHTEGGGGSGGSPEPFREHEVGHEDRRERQDGGDGEPRSGP